MGKRRKKAFTEQPYTASGMPVQDVNNLTRKCKVIIANVLDNSGLGFHQQPAAGNRLVCLLSGTGATKAEAKYPYSVIPFFASPSGLSYWLAVSLEFEFQRGISYLTSVSLLIFQGEATDNQKLALMRAEWATLEDPRASHAQPHWHIYLSHINRRFATESQADFDRRKGVQIFDPQALEIASDNELDFPSEWDRGEKFHFAMASRWHVDGKGSHQEKMDLDKLLKWLDGCLRYTRTYSPLEKYSGKGSPSIDP